jgi:hypothetical protein
MYGSTRTFFDLAGAAVSAGKKPSTPAAGSTSSIWMARARAKEAFQNHSGNDLSTRATAAQSPLSTIDKAATSK